MSVFCFQLPAYPELNCALGELIVIFLKEIVPFLFNIQCYCQTVSLDFIIFKKVTTVFFLSFSRFIF